MQESFIGAETSGLTLENILYRVFVTVRLLTYAMFTENKIIAILAAPHGRISSL